MNSKLTVVGILAIFLMAMSVSVITVKGDAETTLNYNEEIAIPIVVSDYNRTAISVGLTSDRSNTNFAGRDVTGTLVLATGNVQLGLYADVYPNNPSIQTNVFSSMSSGVCWVRLVYVGLSRTGNFTVVLSVGDKDNAFGVGATVLRIPIVFSAESEILVINESQPINVLFWMAVGALGISAGVLLVMVQRKFISKRAKGLSS